MDRVTVALVLKRGSGKLPGGVLGLNYPYKLTIDVSIPQFFFATVVKLLALSNFYGILTFPITQENLNV